MKYLGTVCMLVGLSLVLTGCAGDRDFSDLDAFVKEVNSRPKRPIEPLPEFKAYQAFTYSAANRRSPFEPPAQVEVAEQQENRPVSNVKPDPDRPRQLLENFELSGMSMVGTITRQDDATLYALVDDGKGGIHRVRNGMYLGKNHGKVTEVEPYTIRIVEIVPDGQGGWFERPRVLEIQEDGR